MVMQFIEDIRVYDFEFNLRLQTNRFISASWELKYNNVGTFEGHFPLAGDLVPLIMQNDYLVIAQGDNAAIVTGRQLGTDLSVFGRTCNWILSKRVTPDFDSISGNVEALTRGFVSTAFSDVNNFILGDEIGLTTAIDFWRNTYNPTLDVVRECLENDGAGHKVTFSTTTNQWIYSVIKGSELPLIISEANKNAYDTEITEDCLDLCTRGFYERQAETTQTTEPDTATAENEWIEIIGDATKTGIYNWVGVVSGSNESEATSSLKTKSRKSEITIKARNLVFGRDYHLGDIVRVQLQKGSYNTTVRKRIAGVNIRFAQGNTGEQPVFEDLEE